MKKLMAIISAAAIIASMAGCASWDRAMKNASSEWGNGLNRTVKVYDTVGNEIASYSGKFDIDYEAERILFDDDAGKRHVIYFKTGTVIVDER